MRLPDRVWFHEELASNSSPIVLEDVGRRRVDSFEELPGFSIGGEAPFPGVDSIGNRVVGVNPFIGDFGDLHREGIPIPQLSKPFRCGFNPDVGRVYSLVLCWLASWLDPDRMLKSWVGREASSIFSVIYEHTLITATRASWRGPEEEAPSLLCPPRAWLLLQANHSSVR